VQLYEILCDFSEGPDGARLAALVDGVGTLFDLAEDRFSLRTRFVRRQAAMLADGRAARAAVLPELRDIDLFAGGKSTDAKAGKGVIPKEFTVLAGRASERVNGAFRDTALRHGSDLLT
jgi:hypothetical protein